MQRLKPRHGTCRNDKSKYNNYTFTSVRECVQENTLATMVDECNCIPWYLRKIAENTGMEKFYEDIAKNEGKTSFNDLSDIDQ